MILIIRNLALADSLLFPDLLTMNWGSEEILLPRLSIKLQHMCFLVFQWYIARFEGDARGSLKCKNPKGIGMFDINVHSMTISLILLIVN